MTDPQGLSMIYTKRNYSRSMARKENAGMQRWRAIVRRVYVLDVLWRAATNYADHGGAVYAAAISYYVLFSLFPLLIFALAALGLLVRDASIQDRVVTAIVNQFPPEVNLRGQVETVVSGVAESSITVLGLMGLLTAVWTASGAFGALRRALNRAFDVPGAQSFIRGKVVDLLGVLGVMGLVILSIAATALLGLVRTLSDGHAAGWLSDEAWGLTYFLVPLGLSFVTFLMVYRLVPNLRTRLSTLWIGALLAAVGFELAKAGFGLYVANFGRSQEVYGALGGAVLFLLFVFVVANIAIIAAEVTAELSKDREKAAHISAGRSVRATPGG
jgi:membrane protein